LASPNTTHAEDLSIPLRFHAVNAGYKDDSSAQNYDFIELERIVEDYLELSSFRIVYTNSAGNVSGEISFAENLRMLGNRLVLGASVSPQYSSADGSYYLYDFGSSGLASTAGMLELYYGEDKIDEICWGKLKCDNSYAKFATRFEDNYSLKRCSKECLDGVDFAMEKYYPDINFESIAELPSDEESEVVSVGPSCNGVKITEVYSYYQTNASEQFIELYNPTDVPILLDSCRVVYKNSVYPLFGELAPGDYYAYQDATLSLTKNPVSTNTISVIDLDGTVVDSIDYPNGQKRGTSYALFDANTELAFWRQTYQPTPSSANIYQEFQTCPEDKIINPATGNCVKKVEASAEESAVICPEGKYLNPLTNRCKKIEAATVLTPCKDGYERNPDTNRCRKIENTTTSTECKEGYERNPETNRCRKIRENTGELADYAPMPVEDSEEYRNPKIFIAISTIAVAAIASISYVIYQYRLEIRKAIKAFSSKFRKV
jgi:hypothetical protein